MTRRARASDLWGTCSAIPEGQKTRETHVLLIQCPGGAVQNQITLAVRQEGQVKTGKQGRTYWRSR